jgi:hypothetical protein
MGIQSSNEKYDKGRPENITYKKKGNIIYWKGESLHGVNIKTFRILKDGYAQDINNVFYRGKKIYTEKSRNYYNFKVLKYGYAKDPYIVFYKGAKIKSANSKTFKTTYIIGGAKDKKYKYYKGIKV